jgi:Cu/Ag efflux pump CusA
MTSLAFILGVLPLVTASGAGAEMRQSLGTAVFSGMIGVTVFGLIFTPLFYVLASRFKRQKRAGSDDASHVETVTETAPGPTPV